jgi:hypothetical protein
VFFANCDSTGTGSTSRATKKWNGGARSGNPSKIPSVGSVGKWRLGRVQKMRRKYGTRWGNLQQPMDLLSRSTNTSNVRVEVLLNWFSCARTNNKFKYDVSDSQWIDVDAVISTVTLTYNRAQNLYILDENDANTLNSFLVN